MLVMIDVVGLYGNIPPEEGVKSVGESLQERTTSTVPIRIHHAPNADNLGLFNL